MLSIAALLKPRRLHIAAGSAGVSVSIDRCGNHPLR